MTFMSLFSFVDIPTSPEDNRPLPREALLRIDLILPTVCQLIVVNTELLDSLAALQCITTSQKRFIEREMKNNTVAAEYLLSVVKRRSLQDFNSFIGYLNHSKAESDRRAVFLLTGGRPPPKGDFLSTVENSKPEEVSFCSVYVKFNSNSVLAGKLAAGNNSIQLVALF
jgi:hypothetical protein